MDSTGKQGPSIIKFEATFPAQLLEIDVDGSQTGGVAREAGKSLTCVSRQAYRYVCILVGGQKSMGDGTIVTLHFKIRAGARTGDASVRIDQVEAATADLRPLKILGTEGRVEIH